MKTYIVSLLLSVVCIFKAYSQDISSNLGIGIVYPFERTYVNVELCNKIAPHYVLALSSDVSRVETNLSPKLKMDLNNVCIDLGFGWGHRFGKEEINDHNFHTYTIGLYWIKDRYYVGTSMFWRSNESHIGFHKGTLRLCFGMRIFHKLYQKKP